MLHKPVYKMLLKPNMKEPALRLSRIRIDFRQKVDSVSHDLKIKMLESYSH